MNKKTEAKNVGAIGAGSNGTVIVTGENPMKAYMPKAKNAFAERHDRLMEICDEACEKLTPTQVKKRMESYLTHHKGGKYRKTLAFRVAWGGSLEIAMGDLSHQMGYRSQLSPEEVAKLLEELKEHMQKAVKSGNMKPVATTDVEPV